MSFDPHYYASTMRFKMMWRFIAAIYLKRLPLPALNYQLNQ